MIYYQEVSMGYMFIKSNIDLFHINKIISRKIIVILCHVPVIVIITHKFSPQGKTML